MLTRSSCASTFQEVFARLSKNHARVTFASDTPSRQKVWRLSVSVFVHDRCSHAGNCAGLPSDIGLFLSTGSKNLLPPSTPLNPFRFLTTAVVSISTAWRQSFVIGYTSLHHRFSLFLIIGHRYLLMNLHVVQL